MTEEQLAARGYIIKRELLPPDYDVVIINASCETSINIRGQIDYVVIHSTEEEVRVQVRGRYRNDLEELYVYDKSSLEVPPEFLYIPLFKEDRDNLCEILRQTDDFKRLVKWTKTKEKLLEEGYEITEKRYQNRRYAIISLWIPIFAISIYGGSIFWQTCSEGELGRGRRFFCLEFSFFPELRPISKTQKRRGYLL